jgi:hypothetical protein
MGEMHIHDGTEMECFLRGGMLDLSLLSFFALSFSVSLSFPYDTRRYVGMDHC